MDNKDKLKYKETKLSHERLLELFDYNSETGFLINKINRGRYKIGEKSGYTNSHGYVIVAINRIQYKAHRLVWFYIHKKWPKEQIDHINRTKNDNRIVNLREADSHINNTNVEHRAEKISGIEGITWHKSKQRWRIVYNKKLLCTTDTIKKGIEAQNEAKSGTFVKKEMPRLTKQSGVKGIAWHKKMGKWRVRYNDNHLCYVNTIDEGIKIQKQFLEGIFIKKPKASKQSGIKGIHWDNKSKKWKIKNNNSHLGYRETLHEAILLKKQFPMNRL